MTPEQRAGLDIARQLVELGVPVFSALSWRNELRPPKDWQHSKPNLAVVDAWEPDMGLAAVMGTVFDAVDLDPRNGASLELLRAGGVTYGVQRTPRGGLHGLIAPLRVGKHQSVLPGVDLQGGREDGSGRGFIWIAPTVRYDKAYWWEDFIGRPLDDDVSWAWLAKLATVDKRPETSRDEHYTTAPTDPVPPMYVARFFAEDVPAYVNAEPGTGDTMLLRLTARAREFANAGWVGWDEALEVLDQARLKRIEQHPSGGGQDEADWTRIQRSAVTRVGRKKAVRGPGLLVNGRAVEPAGKARSGAGAPDTEAAANSGASTASVEESTPTTLRVRRASEITIKRAKWLRHGRIPLGELTLIAGREGTGKSTYLAHLAAKVTMGEAAGEYDGKAKSVLYVATEDSWAHTIAPRMRAAGANMDLVYEVLDDVVLPDSIPALVATARELDAAAIMFDPIVSFVRGDLSTDRARDLRKAIEPLRAEAETIDAAVLALVHFNKGEGDVLTKIAGSRGWVEVARAVLGMARNEEEDHVVVSQIKNNLGRLDLPHWAYKITNHRLPLSDGEVAEVGKLEWTSKVETGVAELLAPRERGRPTKGRDPRAVAAWVIGECAADDLDKIKFEVVHRRLGELEGWSSQTTRDRLQRAVDSGFLRSLGSGYYGPLTR